MIKIWLRYVSLACLLCVAQVSSAAEQLLDDFSTDLFDCSNWWFATSEGAITHNATDGDIDILVKPYSTEEGICRNRLRLSNGFEVDSIAADVKINSINHTSDMDYAEIRIYGNFFNTNNDGTTAGDVEPILRFGDRGDGLEVWWEIIETVDAYYQELITQEDFGAVDTNLIPPGTLSTGVYYPMSLSYDGDQTFTFEFNGVSQSYTWPNARVTTAVEGYFKEIQARVSTSSGLTDATGANDLSVSIDDVAVNGVLYDDFNDSLDASLWREGLQSASTDTAQANLTLNVDAANAPSGNYGTRLFIGEENALTKTVIMNARLNDVPLGSHGRVRINGLWYNATKGQGQYDRYQGNVFAQIVIRRKEDGEYEAFYYLEYVIDENWDEYHELHFETFDITINPNVEYELSINQTSTDLEFTIGDGTISETKAFDITAPFSYEDSNGDFVTITPDPKKVTPGLDEKAISIQLRQTAGTINASIDNVIIEEVLTGAENTADSANSIIGESGIDSAVNVGATAEPDEPFHGDIGTSGTPEKSVWFEWTAPNDGVVTFDTSGSSFDTLLSIYDVSSQAGTNQNNFSLPNAALAIDFSEYLKLDGNNDATENVLYSKVSAEVEQGLTYRIAVDGNNSEEGLVVLNYSLEVTPDGTLCFPIKAKNGNIAIICL